MIRSEIHKLEKSDKTFVSQARPFLAARLSTQNLLRIDLCHHTAIAI